MFTIESSALWASLYERYIIGIGIRENSPSKEPRN